LQKEQGERIQQEQGKTNKKHEQEQREWENDSKQKEGEVAEAGKCVATGQLRRIGRVSKKEGGGRQAVPAQIF